MSLIEAIDHHSKEFHRTKDEWSYKMLMRLLRLLNDREGLDYPNYLELIKKANKKV